MTEAKPLSSVLAGTLPTDAVKVTGTVDAVCQAKGCWMVIKDGEMTARVLVKDHAFAIPMDGKGKAAIVEGTLEEKELTEANVAHLKKDGDDTIKGDEARKEYFLHATAVELAQNCFQVFGGIGYTWEHDQHLFLRRLTTDAGLYGDAAWHREHLCQLAGL